MGRPETAVVKPQPMDEETDSTDGEDEVSADFSCIFLICSVLLRFCFIGRALVFVLCSVCYCDLDLFGKGDDLDGRTAR